MSKPWPEIVYEEFCKYWDAAGEVSIVVWCAVGVGACFAGYLFFVGSPFRRK